MSAVAKVLVSVRSRLGASELRALRAERLVGELEEAVQVRVRELELCKEDVAELRHVRDRQKKT